MGGGEMSRGQTMRTPERVELAQELRADGLKWREVADVLGCSLSAAQELATDPNGHARDARKATYSGVCDCCGGPTDGSGGNKRTPPRTCKSCLEWTVDSCLEAFRDFFAEHGRSPRLIDAMAARGMPSNSSVERWFGTWNGGLRAAGLPLNLDREEATTQAMADAVAAGLTLDQAGEQFGCTGTNIRQRMATIGLRVSDLRPCFHVGAMKATADPFGVRAAREAAGITQSDLARLAGVGQGEVSRAEHGQRPRLAPRLVEACKAARP
jgi:DNA-binding XRE family transcriptional regulator